MEQYPMVMQAFNLINETFSRCLPRWRLFQLVFIVSQIPDIAVRQFHEISAHLDEVSIIYFPTGGGKTEAYLGLVVFAMFFHNLKVLVRFLKH